MESDLPDNFDVIVIGTGVTESIVAAAASRIGKRVLHVDKNDFYGNTWASFNFENLLNLNKKVTNTINFCNSCIELISENEQFSPLRSSEFGLEDIEQQWHIDKDIPEDADGWCQNAIMNVSRRFNIDIAPKINYSKGPFISLLIDTNMSRYTEFRSITQLLLWFNDKFEVIPCTRSEVFSNDQLSLVEKRLLMKLIESCAEQNEDFLNEKYGNKQFLDFLQDQNLTENVINLIMYTIVMDTRDVSFQKGLESTKRFLSSTGRYGKTPFIYSMYGSGEISQIFCRVCAVYGGVYCLNRPISGIVFDKSNSYTGVICGRKKIQCDVVVASVDNIPGDINIEISNKLKISRAILITDKSLFSETDGKENLNLIMYPELHMNNLIKIMEQGHKTGVCPKGLFIVHMYCKQFKNAKSDLNECISKIFNNENGPKILWSMFYSTVDTSMSSLRTSNPRLYACSGPDFDLDLDLAINQAKSIFQQIYPGEDFLPQLPETEEVVIDDTEMSEK